jgi:hypothetical protein
MLIVIENGGSSQDFKEKKQTISYWYFGLNTI